MWIRKKEITELSDAVRACMEGECEDIRDNKEGEWSILKNDIYALACARQEQVRQLEQERNVLSEYMADISHQLKTPITSMLIMADLLEATNPEKQQEFIGNIKMSLTKMEWLVSGLLKMAKLDSKAVEFHPTVTKVSELVAAIKPSVEVLLDVNNQTMHVEHDMEILCDKRWTTEAFLNIVKNAIEHSREGGSIVIDSGDNPIYQWISILDSGEGMKEEQYAALFKRFEHSTNENGFGIGMPLALSIIRGQGGDIDIDFGGNGKGATFFIKFYK